MIRLNLKSTVIRAASKPLRKDLAAVQLVPSANEAEAFAAATNGLILAVSREATKIDRRVFIPASVCRSKAGEVEHEILYDETNKQWSRNSWNRRRKKKVVTAPEKGRRFPRTQDVLPNVSGDTHIAVTLDAKQLAKLASAMGTNNEESDITLFIPVPKRGEFYGPIPAVQISDSTSIGAIAVVCSNSDRNNSFAAYNRLRDEYVSAANAAE
jgi:hypothetical protein